jgi:hypothetical protein
MPWWIVILEGLIGLGVGLYILTQPAAGGQIVLILAVYLLVISVERALLGFRERIPPGILAERMLRAGIGLTVGAIIVLDAWQPFMTSPAPLVILSLGWLLIGLIGIWEWITAGKELGLGLGGLISPIVSALFGLLMLGSRMALGGTLLQILGIVATVAGVALLLYGFILYRSSKSATPFAEMASDNTF